MSDESLPRNPDLASRDDTALLVVDVQEKLMPLIPDSRRLIWNIRRLIDGAQALGLPVLATEQYPQGLGPTVPELAEKLGDIPSKTTFSCGGCPELFRDLLDRGVFRLLIAG
ncbi:MAG: isochorismatase family protein, partial [Planctomycetales bacterium]